MATVEELETKIDTLIETTDRERNEVQALLTELRAEIAALIAAGQPNLDPLAAKLDAAIVSVELISEPVTL